MPAAEIEVTINGSVAITFNDFTTTPAYLLRGTPRLLSTLSVRQTQTDRQGEHGVHDSLSFYGARILPFDGEILGTSQADRKTKEDALKQCLSLPTFQSYTDSDGYVLVEFTDEDGSLKQCYAKVLEPPVFDVLDDVDPSRRGFTFLMIAKDPRLYSQTLQSEDGDETYQGTNFTVVQGISPTVPFQLYANTEPSVTCDNGGSYDAPPVITVTGPTEDPRITNVTTGKFILLDGLILGAGESVTIDVGRRTILENDGTNLSGFFASGSTWWVLTPGANVITLLDATPSLIEATIEVEWRDTYI